jgi:hypothetical protein
LLAIRDKKSWEEVFERHPILRTRLMRNSYDGLVRQVVIDEQLWWQAPKNFDDYMSTNFPSTDITYLVIVSLDFDGLRSHTDFWREYTTG